MPRRRNRREDEDEGADAENRNASKILVRPREKGEGQSLFDYVSYFERVINANRWDDDEAGRIFAAMLGPTDRTLDALEERWETFSQIKALLVEKQKPLREAKLTELMYLKIKEGEQIETLRNRTMRLVTESYPDFPYEIQIRLARDHFLHALEDSLRIQVLVAKPITLEDTVSVAQSCTLLMEKERCVSVVTSRERAERNFHRNEEKFKTNNESNKVQCFRCRGFGHIQRFCKSKRYGRQIAFVDEEQTSENTSLLRNTGQSQ